MADCRENMASLSMENPTLVKLINLTQPCIALFIVFLLKPYSSTLRFRGPLIVGNWN